MARPPSGAEVLAIAKQLLRSAKTASEIRVAQAVILPLEHGFSLTQTAALIGKSPSWVARERGRFIAERGMPARAAHGGRRHQLLSVDEETLAVKQGIMRSAYRFGDDMRNEIRERLEAKVGRIIADSTLDSIIRRVAGRYLPEGTAYDLRYLNPRLTETWLRERVEVQKAMGKKFAV